MAEFIDITGKKKDGVNCTNSNDPDPTSNINNCYDCTNVKCGCSNSEDYKEKLVKKITEEVLKEITTNGMKY